MLFTSFESLASKGSEVIWNQARFTVFNERVIRMEYGVFEDRPSQTFWFRKHPVPKYEFIENEEGIEIKTSEFILRYTGGAFSKENLSVEICDTGKVWHYGDVDKENLLGTFRTLDNTAGTIKLEQGIISKQGFTVIDDSNTLVFENDGWVSRRNDGGIDLYMFCYGSDYKTAIKDFTMIAGEVPMIPRYLLGNWWSKYHAYSQDELLDLMKKFKSKDVPLSVCVIDMDWHITSTPEIKSCWTGYTWNKELFPEPQKLLKDLHDMGLKVSLNLHQHEGIFPHEFCYEDMAKQMGLNPETKETIEFNIADRRFAEGYFKYIMHPHEEDGVDFWWIDWQQGTKTSIEGLDPLYWLNHLHFYDLCRDGEKRSVIFSRWGGLGGHRYPIGFSGDTVISWESLDYQPEFTATAANVAYGWWSNDIGGHMFGRQSDELYTRWLQFGVFSPIMRIHSYCSIFAERLPWRFNRGTFEILRDYMKLRHQLIPYIYSMAYRAHKDSLSLCLPLYYEYPEEEKAYKFKNEYYFGSELIVAPVTTKIDPDTGRARTEVWLPEGDWFDYFSGKHYKGGKVYPIYSRLEEVPVFAKAGAIIPLGQVEFGNVDLPETVTLKIFPGNGEFLLYEDDGLTNHYKNGMFAVTKIKTLLNGNVLNVKIVMHHGVRDILPSNRTYDLEICLPDGNKIMKKGLSEGTDINILLDGYQDMLHKPETLTELRQRVFKALLDFNIDLVDKDRIYSDILPSILENHANAIKLSKMLSGRQIRMLMELITMECIE